ncbi:MAG: ribonuclease HI [Desulfobacterales bacterium]
MFKGNKVWQAFGPDEKPLYKNDKVLIKYNPNQDYEYWVYENKLEPVDKPQTFKAGYVQKPALPEKKKKQKSDEESSPDDSIPEDTIVIYTDGASSGNPGPSGIGVLLRFGKYEKEISRDIGITTNNIAELEAIRAALLELKTTKKPVRIFTDSAYAFGVLTLNWKAKKNENLIDSIKKSMKRFNNLKLIKIRGHAGREGNERADFLANKAVKK